MNRKTNNTASSVIQTTEGRKNLGNTKWTLPRSFAPLWMTISMVLLLTSCTQDDTLTAEQEITLTTPVIELSGVQASTRAVQDMESVASGALVSLFLHDSEARYPNREGYYQFSDPNSWTAHSSVTVTGGEGHYRAGINANISLNATAVMPGIGDAIYAYRGSVNVKADGTFTPDGTLQPYSAAVLLNLKDANGANIKCDDTDVASNTENQYVYLIKPVGLAQMNNFVPTDANGNVDANGQYFPNGTAAPVPGAWTWDYSFQLTTDAVGYYTPGTYPTTWEEGGKLVPSATPTAPWPLFEVIYCKDGFEWSSTVNDYVPLGPATIWTVSYPATQLTLEAGKLYTFTAALGADASITLDAGAVSISDWSEGETINVGR